MNLLMIWFMIWRCGTSLTQMMIMNPTEIFKSNIIKTIKTHAITACWLECQQTSGCESFGPDSDNEKINDLALLIAAYLVAAKNKSDSSNETPLKVTEISPFTVSYFEFVCSIISSCFFIVSCSFGVCSI